MKILVTGATGFIGSHLCFRLRADGHDVVGVDLDVHKGGSLDAAGVELIEGDLACDVTAVDWLDGCDALIHVAGLLGPQGLPYKKFYEVNVEGTQRIVGAALDMKLSRIIHFSSVGILGSVERIPVSEDYPCNPGDAYEQTKYEAEQWVMAQAKTLPGISVIRPAWVYGPGDRRTLKLFKALKKGRFFFIGNGRGLQHPVYIDDLVDGVVCALGSDQGSGEIFHVAGPDTITIHELVTTVCDVLGVQVPGLNLPYKPMRLMGQICETVCGVMSIDPPLSVAKVDFFVKNRAYSIEKAKKLLGYSPKISFKDGLTKTLDWYREQKWL